MTQCSICGAGEMHPKFEQHIVSYNGQTDIVEHRSHFCVSCQSDFSTADDARENKRAMIRFRKMVDGIPLGVEIRGVRARGELSQQAAAEIFGGGPVAFSKYENDDLIPDDAMVNLLKLAIFDSTIIQKLRTIKGAHIVTSVCNVVPEAVPLPYGEWENTFPANEAGPLHVNRNVVVAEGSYDGAPLWKM